MKRKIKSIVAAMAAFAASAALAADFNVREYGAKGDGATKDTSALQSAIDACGKAGGGRVVLADGTFLSAPIRLRSGVELHIDRTAKLLASPDIADFRDWPDLKHVVNENLPRGRSASFIFAEEADNIAVTGGGTIDCNGEQHIKEKEGDNWTGWKYVRKLPKYESLPRVLFFAGCRDVVLKDVTMVNQPAGWSYWIHDCDRVQIRGLKILANVRYPNNDGIHVNCSRDVTISDCIVETGDDSIIVRANSRSLHEDKPCERVVMANCVLRSWSCGIRLGWTNDGVIRDCSFSNIVIHDTTTGIGFTLPKKKESPGWTDFGREDTLIERITFSDIRMNGIYGRPISASIASPEMGTRAKAIRDIRFVNVQATGLELPYLTGRTDCPLRDFTFSGCSFRTVPEDALPEDWKHHGTAVGNRRSELGFVMKHTEGFRFENTVFDTP